MARSSWAAGPRSVPAIFWVPPEASRAGSAGAVSATMAPVSRAGMLPSSPPSVSYSPTAPGPLAVPGTCSTMSSAQVPLSKGSGSASGSPPGVAAVGSREGSCPPSAARSRSAWARSGALIPSRAPASSAVGAESGPASMSVDPTSTSSPAGEAGSVSSASSITSRSPRSTWSSLTTELAYSSASWPATVASSGVATAPTRTTSSSRVATSIRSSPTRVDTRSRSRILSSTSASTAIGSATSSSNLRAGQDSGAGAPLPKGRLRESGRPLALQAGLLHVQVVVEAAGHLGRDRAPLPQPAQLLPLDPEQVVDQLGNGPGPVRLAVGGLLVQVGQPGPVALPEPLDQLGRDLVGLRVERVQVVEGDLGQPGQGPPAVTGGTVVVGHQPEPPDHQRQGQALADQGDHDHREGQEHHQVPVREGAAVVDLGGDGQGEGQRHHSAHAR